MDGFPTTKIATIVVLLVLCTWLVRMALSVSSKVPLASKTTRFLSHDKLKVDIKFTGFETKLANYHQVNIFAKDVHSKPFQGSLITSTKWRICQDTRYKSKLVASILCSSDDDYEALKSYYLLYLRSNNNALIER